MIETADEKSKLREAFKCSVILGHVSRFPSGLSMNEAEQTHSFSPNASRDDVDALLAGLAKVKELLR